MASKPEALHKIIKHGILARKKGGEVSKNANLVFTFTVQTVREDKISLLATFNLIELSSKSTSQFDRSRFKKVGSFPLSLRKLECLFQVGVLKQLFTVLEPTNEVNRRVTR